MSKQKIIFMPGQPSVGKTTTAKEMAKDKEHYIINVDEIFISVAKENGYFCSERKWVNR